MAQPWKVKGLDPDHDVLSCLKKILRTRVREVFSFRSLAVTKRDVEGLHDMRVAVRRLIAVAAIFRPWFASRRLKKHTRTLKILLDALGNVRDADIFIASLLQYRNSVEETDRSALDLIIAHERHGWGVYRKHLQATVRGLEEERFAKKFRKFIRTSSSYVQETKRAALPVQTLRGYAREIVPALLDAFLSQGAGVIAHPRMQKKLHAMRIDGKRVRYGMEIFTEIFGLRYGTCLEEIKTFLDVMGTIHDIDVHVPRLVRQLKDIRSSNALLSLPAERMRTQGVVGCIKHFHDQRKNLFTEMAGTLTRWDRDKFVEAIARSMT